MLTAKYDVLTEIRLGLEDGSLSSSTSVVSRLASFATAIGATDWDFGIAVNDSVAHLKDMTYFLPGDVVSVDSWFKLPTGLWIDGAVSAVTMYTQNYLGHRLVAAGRLALYEATKLLRPHTVVRDIGAAIEKAINAYNGKIVTHGAPPVRILKTLTGHMIGTQIHQAPGIPNYFRDSDIYLLKVGDRLAIEPLLTYNKEDFDHNSWKTLDGSLATHIEGTFEITENGFDYLYGPAL